MKKSLIVVLVIVAVTVLGIITIVQKDSKSDNNSDTAKWPQKTINVVITHGAGGDTDYNARLMCRMLEKKLGVSVVPVNITGSNGAIALSQYKNEKGDGYTFIMTNTAALTGNEATGLSDFGYESFETVGIFCKQAGENVIVPGDSPYKTLKDLFDASMSRPNSIKYGVSTGGGVYIASVIMEHSIGTKFITIEAGDAANRMTSLLGGHVDTTIVPYSIAKEYIEAGSVRSLCTLLDEAPALIEDIPAAKDLGYDELVLNTLYACLAPKETPPEILKAFNDAMLEIVKNNEEYKIEVNKFNFQEPWALDIEDSKTELKRQRELFMKYQKLLTYHRSMYSIA